MPKKSLSVDRALLKAQTHVKKGEWVQAAQIYEAVLKKFPQNQRAIDGLNAVQQQHPNKEEAAEVGEPVQDAIDGLLALYRQGRLRETIEQGVALADRFPNEPFIPNIIGAANAAMGRFKEAVVSYNKALKLKPDYAEAHNNLGNALKNLGQLDDAAGSYRRALRIRPHYAKAYSNLGVAMSDLRQLDEAVASYRRALQIKPDLAEAHSNLGDALRDLGQLDDAVASYRRALQIKPDLAEAHSNLGHALSELGQLDDAVASCRRALQIRPDYAEAHNNLGNALRGLGQIDEAVASCRRALQIKPDYAHAYSNMLFAYAYSGSLEWQEYLEQARGWEKACFSHRARQAARRKSFVRLPRSGRILRVGYVSGDYRQHAVSYFLESLFASHDRDRFEVFAYNTNSFTDEVTARIKHSVEHWVSLVGISDTDALGRIETDAIDVLIDLSGHTAHNRLGLFARRAAPVQAHYLGYFASTGLTEMDYWIGDEVLTPPLHDAHFSECVWRLPRVRVAYHGQAAAPTPAWRPAADGTVWLGSFNNLGKLTPHTLALWARVLHALPEGRLLLKTKDLADATNRRRVLDTMAGHGIAPDRIELRDRSATPDWAAHMAYYSRLDIALDPVGGHSGVTTTCDALWMAVPVVALMGNSMASRTTASMLAAIGHPEWYAESDEEYVAKVVALAKDLDGRKAVRAVQRQQTAQSPLCDSVNLTKCLEQAYLQMFDRWQERQEPEQVPAL
ncbi:MAG: hypothetical protein A3G25_05310 [Betaproteobacteria bacterium RIFCSPLOWO2_12_FULL_63_13]|nr:MAG: hypothetical protein A3G25_05310 [Betaproteobacteria bacterium RIFCSPLOWO2_12_FULL_63_13]